MEEQNDLHDNYQVAYSKVHSTVINSFPKSDIAEALYEISKLH